jgi:uncharacterized membrane protein
MEMDLWLDVLLRWMHVFAAIAAVGGMFFMRLALLPAVTALPEEHRRTLHAAVRTRWSKVVAGSIGFLLVSGLINFVLIVRRYELPSFYHALFGVKFLLALAIFFIASVLMGRSAMADRFRRNVRFWLTLNVALAVVLVGISGVLKTAPKKLKPPELLTKSVDFDQGSGFRVRGSGFGV